MSEPTQKSMRAILPLLKVRVVEHTETSIKLAIGAEYGAPTTMLITRDMRSFDIRDGDLLTLYTEVLLLQPQGSA